MYADLLGPVAVISNLFGNIAIFMPFGFLVPILGRKKRKFWFTALLGFELSLSVECIQLVTKTGCFDVDDIFLNTIVFLSVIYSRSIISIKAVSKG